MKSTIIMALLASIASNAPTEALAQDGADVVVMRRVIAPAGRATVKPDGRWVEGDWRWATENTCSDAALMTRDVGCQVDGREVADGRCLEPKPAVQTTSERLDGCTYDWRLGGWSEYSNSCGTGTRTRYVSCVGTSGDLVGRAVRDEMCPAPVPNREQGGTVLTGCGYSWTGTRFGEWDSSCATNASRSVTWACRRSDGEVITQNPVSYCGARPEAFEFNTISAGCNNAVANSSFETLDTSWGRNWTRSSDVARSGSHSAKLGGYNQPQPAQGVAQTKAGSTYVVSFWAYQKAGGTGGINVAHYGIVEGSSSSSNMISFRGIGPSWTKFTFKVTTTGKLTLVFSRGLNDDPDTYIDDVTIDAAL